MTKSHAQRRPRIARTVGPPRQTAGAVRAIARATVVVIVAGTIATLAAPSSALAQPAAPPPSADALAPAAFKALPAPDREGTQPFESLLQARRSVRRFLPDTLTTQELAQLLWAAAGRTQTGRVAHRTIPSAGALYPLEIYAVRADGIARYDVARHGLEWGVREDRRQALAEAALGQLWIAEAPLIVVLAAEPARTGVKYGPRGERYILIEVGCATQNLLLAAVALELGATPVGAFRDEEVARLLELPEGQEPLLLVPIGHPRQD